MEKEMSKLPPPINKVIDYLQAQPEIDHDNIKKFKEEVDEYDQAHPSELVWHKISEYIDRAGNDNDQFLVLLEEDYKDLSTHLFNAQYGVLDDFDNSASVQDNSDNEIDKDEKEVDQQVNSYTDKTHSYENEPKRADIDTADKNKKEEDDLEDNIYDDDQDDNIQDSMRKPQDDSDEENESSYDPCDANKLNPEEEAPKVNINGMTFNMMHPGFAQMKGMPKFISNPQKQTFDPRILDQNAKMMQMMAKNAQMMGGMYPNAMQMGKGMHANPQFMMAKPLPAQMMGYNVHKPMQMGKMTAQGNITLNFQSMALNDKIVPKMMKQEKGQGRPNESGQKPQKHHLNSILVKNIPADKNKIGSLAGYFSKFGDVTNVSVNNNKSTAVVRFENPMNAKDAYM